MRMKLYSPGIVLVSLSILTRELCAGFHAQNNESSIGHVLMYHPWNTKSHRIQQNALLQGLLAKGHRVTGVFPQKSEIKNENYTEIVVHNGIEKIMQLVTKQMMERSRTGPLDWMMMWPMWSSMMTERFAEVKQDNEYVLQYIRENNITFSVVTFTNVFGFLGLDLMSELNPGTTRPGYIGISNIGWAHHIQKYLGNPDNPSFQPELFSTSVEPMNFKQRLINTLIYSHDFNILGWIIWPMLGEFMDFLDVEAYKSFILHDVDMLFLASHFVTHSPQAWAPNTIEIGGIHCRDGEELPSDLHQFLDSHPDGVIYVSFGSTVKPSEMSPERKQIFLDAFSKLGKPIIWKWDEENVSDIPSNVMIKQWVPQQDVLAHPNLKVFVTHGGLLSVQEALYHKTPLVGIPLGNDQRPNLLRAVREGYATIVDWDSISSDNLYHAIKSISESEDVRVQLERAHDLFVDQKESPLERAVWWVEYLIRHGNTQFLKPYSTKLEWHQYHLLDVFAFIGFIIIMIITLVMSSCFCLYRKCCKSKIKRD